MKAALVAGSTGLVGEELVKLLADDTYYSEIKVLSRREFQFQNPKITNVVVPDFDKLPLHGKQLAADDVYCCLGTTIKKAGSKENFKKVDFQYPVNLADHALKNGAQKFILISAMGADVNSMFFYNQVKGMVEQELRKMPYKSMLVLRPSLLLGDRKENRVGEKIVQIILPLFSPLMVGSLKKYRAIKAVDVAQAMVNAAKEDLLGYHIFDSNAIEEISKPEIT